MEAFSQILDPYFWIKIVILFLTLCYCAFSAVLLNQVRSMDKIISLPPTKIVLSIAFFNILLGAFLFLMALVIL